jgi:autotransporter-associated beta strand protein
MTTNKITPQLPSSHSCPRRAFRGTSRTCFFTALAAAVIVLGGGMSAAQAQTTWGNTGTEWTSGTSWVGGIAPANSISTVTNTAVFTNLGAGFNVVNLSSDRRIYGVLFTDGANAYTFTGGALNINGAFGISNVSANVQTFNNKVINASGNTTYGSYTAGGSLVFAGGIDLTDGVTTNNRTLTLGGSGNITVSGAIANGGTATAGLITVTNTALTTLSGNNTYGGTTIVQSNATLRLGSANALGGTTAGTTVSSGATLDLSGQTVGAEPLTLSGTGVAAAGALRNTSESAASLAGPITLARDTTIGLSSGNITLSGNIGETGVARNLVIAGTNGVLTLSGSNSYSGLTTLTNLSTIRVTSVDALSRNSSLSGASSSTRTGTLDLAVGNYTVNSYASGNFLLLATNGAATLRFTNIGAGNFILGGDRSITATNVAVTFDGSVDISPTASAKTFAVAGNSDFTFNGSILTTNTGFSAEFRASSTGRTTLNASNNYNGLTTVSAGAILRLGNANALGTTLAGTVVASGAAIDLNGQVIAEEALTIEGSGINTNGAIFNSSSAAASWSGAVSLTNDMIVGVTNGSITISGNISQSGGGKDLTKIGAGTLFLSGSNSYSGLTTMNGGTIQVSSPNALAAASALAGAGSANITNVLRLDAAGSYIMESVQVPGLMMVEGPAVGSATLTFTNGGSMSGSADKTISSGSGVTIIFNGATFDTGNPGNGIRDLGISGDGNTVFNAAIVSTNSSTVNATRILKQGAGTMTLNGANTYLGSTVISSGSLELGSSGSLRFFAGASGSNNAVSGAGAAVLGGTFNIDLSAASTNSGSSWTLVSVASRSYVGSFNVAGFTNSGGTWSYGTNGVTYQFSQLTGTLSIVSTNNVSGYTAWLTNYPTLVDTNGAADPDGDGFDNNMEFAFNGNPTVGSPAMISAASSAAGPVFSFLASTNTNAVTYVVQSTTDLRTVPWADNSGVTASITNSSNQANVPLAPSYVRREFTVTPAGSKFFYRVKATIAP